MNIVKLIRTYWTPISVQSMMQREIDIAERELLTARTDLDMAEARCEFNEKRLRRLRGTLLTGGQIN